MGVAASLRTKKLEQRLHALEQQLRALALSRGDEETGTAAEDGTEGPWSGVTAEERQAETSGAGRDESTPGAGDGETIKPLSEAAQAARQSFEERIGTRWAVWTGGLALVLGGIFLVRYSIEAGLMTPAARVLSGALLALALVGAGEWLQRKRLPEGGAAGTGPAYIPGVLTLAGTTTAFATVFVAHALYGLIGPGFAFLLLASVAIMSLVAAVRHGPAVASYGLLASYVVPFLVSSDQPAVWPLTLYGIFVSLAAYGVARIRLWRWLAFGAAAGAVFWGHVLAYASTGPWHAGALAFYILAVSTMAAFVFVVSLYPRGGPVERQDWPAVLVLFLHGFLTIYLLQVNEFGAVSIAVLIVVAAALMMIAAEWPAAAAAAIGGSALIILGYVGWEIPLSPEDLTPYVSPISRISLAFADPSARGFPTVGLMLGLLSGGMGLWGTLRSPARWALSAAGAATPLALLGIGYFRVAPLETSMFFGSLSLMLAAIFLSSARFVERRLPLEAAGREAALAAYSIGTVGAIAAGMAILLQHGWLPIGLGLLAAGTIRVWERWPLATLTWVALGVAVLTWLTIAYDPTIVGPGQLGRTPVFNALLYGYGVPTLAFSYCAWRLARRNRGRAQQGFEALALFSVLVTLAVLIHHATNGGVLDAPADTLREWSLHTLVLLAGTLAAQRLDRFSHSPTMSYASYALGILGFLTSGWLHLFALNPLFTGEAIGRGLVLNLLLVAYFIPAVLFAAIASWSAATRPRQYRMIAGALGAALMFAWISLEVRAIFHRPHLDAGVTTEAELYTYSAAWLLFGIGLLTIGFRLQSRMLRLSSAIFVVAAVAKVFLFDMAGLSGVWRALSFIGLGAVLIGIGLLYQRLLARSAGALPVEEKPGPA